MSLSPEPFSLSPLLALLPNLGSVTRLEGLVSSLFARHQAIEASRDNADSGDIQSKLASEGAMLLQILDWLAVQPVGEVVTNTNSGVSTTAALRASYSREELVDIYALVKVCLETGQIKRAEVIARGLITVAPDFVPGWLASAIIQASAGNLEAAQDAARRALKAQPDSAVAMIVLVTTSLTLGDRGTAGTYLGEINEMIEQGSVTDPNLIRVFKMQMARYHQAR